MPNTAQPSAPPEPDWVDRPEGIPGCPPGLEYLLHVDQLLVKQQVEIFEGKTFMRVWMGVWYSLFIKNLAHYSSH